MTTSRRCARRPFGAIIEAHQEPVVGGAERDGARLGHRDGERFRVHSSRVATRRSHAACRATAFSFCFSLRCTPMGCSTSKKETVTTGQQGHADYGGDYPFVDKMYSSSVKVKDLLSDRAAPCSRFDWTEFRCGPTETSGETARALTCFRSRVSRSSGGTTRRARHDLRFLVGRRAWARRYDVLRRTTTSRIGTPWVMRTRTRLSSRWICRSRSRE